MRAKFFSLLLVMSLCGLWGCAKSKPVESAAAGVQPVVDPKPEPTPVVDPKPEQIPARSPAPAAKPEATPANSPKVKASNDVAVQPEGVAHKETKETNASKEKNTEIKPADMKVANAFDRNPYLSSMLK